MLRKEICSVPQIEIKLPCSIDNQLPKNHSFSYYIQAKRNVCQTERSHFNFSEGGNSNQVNNKSKIYRLRLARRRSTGVGLFKA